MTDCVKLYNEEIKDGMEGDADEEETEADEHVWTSPANAIKIVNAIAVQLTDIDAKNAGKYMDNAQSYSMLLSELDANFRALAGEINNPTLIFADTLAIGYPLAFEARADERETRGFTSIR